MKRWISAMLAVLLLLCLAGCRPTRRDVEATRNADRDALLLRQGAVVDTFGRTQENDRIVGFQTENNYFRYVVVYYVNGVRGEEITHFLIFTPALYQEYKARFAGGDGVDFDDETQHISMRSAIANGNSYAEDLAIIQKDYELR